MWNWVSQSQTNLQKRKYFKMTRGKYFSLHSGHSNEKRTLYTTWHVMSKYMTFHSLSTYTVAIRHKEWLNVIRNIRFSSKMSFIRLCAVSHNTIPEMVQNYQECWIINSAIAIIMFKQDIKFFGKCILALLLYYCKRSI